MGLDVEFCGEWYRAAQDEELVIGREGDVRIDDNPYLHRRFLTISWAHDLWWLANVGSQVCATVADAAGLVQAWLAPGASLPIVFGHTCVLFTAGPTTYELNLHNADTPFIVTDTSTTDAGETTIAPVTLTESQRLLVVVLAEPLLRRDGTSVTEIPSSRAAAARLGWEMTRFNRKLDNVCDKLDKRGIKGLRGAPGQLAVNRRARLVEHAVTSRLVTEADLALLDRLPNSTRAGA